MAQRQCRGTNLFCRQHSQYGSDRPRLASPEWIAALGMPARLVDSSMVVHAVNGWPTEERDEQR